MSKPSMLAFGTNCSMAIFYTLREAKIVIEGRRRRYNAIRARIARIQTTSTGGVHTRARRMAGSTTSTGFAMLAQPTTLN